MKKRGDRINKPYQGTIIEVTSSIPDDCLCVNHRGKPGYLVYWDFLTDEFTYEEVLGVETTKKAANNAYNNLQWISCSIETMGGKEKATS